MRRALIVGKDRYQARNVLSATRALGEAGWDVGIGSPARGLAARSRWATRWHTVPSPTHDFGGFVEATNRAIRGRGYSLVFAGGDAEVIALAAAAADIRATIPYPPLATTVSALDKLILTTTAERLGMGVPQTRPAITDAVQAIDGEVLVKARLHWQPGVQGVPDRLSALRVNDAREAEVRVAEIRAAGGEAVLQEVIDGRHTAYVAVLDQRHKVLVAHQQDGFGTWPPRDGVWVRAQTVPLAADLGNRCAQLLRELGWTGLVQLQFLVGSDGVPRLIDLNGRFYASIGLAHRAGVNLPALWADSETGARPHAVGRVRPGVRYQWLEGDLQRAMKERRGGLLADLAATLRYGIGAVGSLWRLDDLKPAVAWVLSLVGRIGARLRRSVSGLGLAKRARSRSRA